VERKGFAAGTDLGLTIISVIGETPRPRRAQLSANEADPSRERYHRHSTRCHDHGPRYHGKTLLDVIRKTKSSRQLRYHQHIGAYQSMSMARRSPSGHSRYEAFTAMAPRCPGIIPYRIAPMMGLCPRRKNEPAQAAKGVIIPQKIDKSNATRPREQQLPRSDWCGRIWAIRSASRSRSQGEVSMTAGLYLLVADQDIRQSNRPGHKAYIEAG